MRTTIRAMGLLLILCIAASAVVKPEEKAKPFALKNADDVEFNLSATRTGPLVLLFTTRDLGDFSLAWHDSIHAYCPKVKVQSVLDLSDVSSWLHGLAKIKIRAKGSTSIIDWDGEVSEAWRGKDRSEIVAVGLHPDNTVMFVVKGKPEPANVKAVTDVLKVLKKTAE
jgi:hypothetical protein